MWIPICNYRRIRAKNCSWLIADRSDDSGQFPLLSTQSIIHPPWCWATYQATKPFTKHRTTVNRPSKRTLKLLTYNAIQTNLFFWFVQTGLIMASWHCLYFSFLNTYKKNLYIFMYCKILYNAGLPTLAQNDVPLASQWALQKQSPSPALTFACSTSQRAFAKHTFLEIRLLWHHAYLTEVSRRLVTTSLARPHSIHLVMALIMCPFKCVGQI